MAINKPDFLAGYSLFYESARYGGDFMAAIENNRDFSMSPSLALRSAIFTKSMGAERLLLQHICRVSAPIDFVNIAERSANDGAYRFRIRIAIREQTPITRG